MADNTQVVAGTGDTIRDKDRGGIKTQIVGLDVGIGGSEQLMSAAALADATANPTLPGWGAFPMLWNGTTWDRAPGSAVGAVVLPSADSVTTGTITAAGQSVTVAVGAGMQGVGVAVYGTYATGLTLAVEASPDGGTTYQSIGTKRVDVVTTADALTIQPGVNGTTFVIGVLPPGATHIRVRASSWGAPSGTANIRLTQTATQRVSAPNSIATVTSISSISPGTGATSLGKAEDAVAASGDVGVFALGVRNEALAVPTSNDGDYSQVSLDARGAVFVNPAMFLYSHISTATTTTVKSGAGNLHSISVNTKGTVASTITVFDNTAGSGTVIGVIDSLNLSGAFVLDVAFTTGLTIVTTGTVSPDITVSYR